MLYRTVFPAAVAVCLGLPALGQHGFAERAQEVGLIHECLSGFDRVGTAAIHDWLQAGVGLGDLDGDGDPDVVACGGLLANHVFRNDLAAGFVDVTDRAGVEVGENDRAPAIGDYDRDGDLDLFLGAVEPGQGALPGRSRLYRNEGALRFEDVTALAGTTGAGHSVYPRWSDLDRDGWLDLLVGEFHATRNLWYRNNSDGSFSERAAALGLDSLGAAHAVAVADPDRDGQPDVMVGNDWLACFLSSVPDNEGDLHLHGDGGGAFSDVTPGSGYGHERGIMGIAWGDVDHDGDLDVYKTDIDYNKLMLNHGWPGSGQPWTEAQYGFGVANAEVPFLDGSGKEGPTSGWAAIFLDANNDSWDDLFVVNGHVAGVNPDFSWQPRGQQNFLFECAGPDAVFQFADRTAEYGLLDHVDDRGGAAGDLDLDGDLDLLVTPTVGPLRYFESRVDTTVAGWIEVLPVTGTSAPGGVGVEVEWTDSAGWPHLRVVGADAPTASQNEWIAHMGLGGAGSVDLTVRYPSGMVQSIPGVAANTRLQAVEPELVRVSHPTIPAISVAPPGPVGLFWVEVFAHDSSGVALDAGAEVSIEVPSVGPVGPVQHILGNHFARVFWAPAWPGEYPVLVSIDGWRPTVAPVVRAVGLPDPSTTEVRLYPEAVRAGSADGVLVQVAPKDADGLAIGSGRVVALTLEGAQPGHPAADMGDGRYSVQIVAPTAPGAYSLGLLVDGVSMPGVGTLVAAGAADPDRTEVVLDVPHPAHSAAPHQIKLRVIPRDAAGRPLGPSAEVELVVSPLAPSGGPPSAAGPGAPVTGPSVGVRVAARPGRGALPPASPGPAHPAVDVETLPASSGRGDGTFAFVLAKPEGQDTLLPSGWVGVRVDGVVVKSVPFSFEY